MVLVMRKIAVIALVFGLAGCETMSTRDPGVTTRDPNVPTAEKDRGPDQSVDVSHIPDPVPRAELRTIAGNRTPYRVLGRTYNVLEKPEGYSERGVASWYGKKFHGKRTSNGELYNMFGMTAAHKTLPIPSYVRVRNLQNDRSVIVRVNDRGPFHGDRVIDLTYSAAKKLGFENVGTARVLVEYIDPHSYQAEQDYAGAEPQATGEPRAPVPTNSAGYELPPNTFLQVGAFGKRTSAETLRGKILALGNPAVLIVAPKAGESLYKVRVGPFVDNLELLNFREQLMKANFPSPHVVNP